MRVEILHLDLHDVHDLLFRKLRDLGLVRLFGAGGQTAAFFKRTKREATS